MNGIRNREQRVGFQLPPGVDSANLLRSTTKNGQNPKTGGSAVFDGLMQHAPTWRDLEWLLSLTRLPVVVKGVLHPDDALRAAELGAAGIVVSNYGGRTLDTLPASLDALPAIARRLQGRVPFFWMAVSGGAATSSRPSPSAPRQS